MARNSWVVDAARGVVGLSRGDQKREFSLEDLPEDIRSQLVLHGLKQKLADASANPDTDSVQEADRVWANLKDGIWAERRAEDIGQLIWAVAEVKFDGDEEKAQELLDAAGALPKEGDSEEDAKKRKALRVKLRKADDLKEFFPKVKKGIDDILGK